MRFFHKKSPYFREDGFSLYQGNSLKLLEELPEESIDMVFADPPYNLSNGGFTCHGGQRVSVNKGEWDQSNGLQKDFDFHQRWLSACHRALKPEGTIWISGSYHSIFTCGYALLRTGFKILNDICWFKPNGSPNLSCRYFTASHETLIWAIKDPKSKHTFNYESMKFGDWHQKDALKRESKQMRSVWSISTARGEEKKQGKHPTQKPLTLLRRIILSSTKEGDLILDPFTGSGTSGIASYLHGRYFMGFEIDNNYLELSVRRFKHLRQSMMNQLAQESDRIIYPDSSAKDRTEKTKKKTKIPRNTKSTKNKLCSSQEQDKTAPKQEQDKIPSVQDPSIS